MSYISQTLILKNKIHWSFLFLTLVVDFAHQMGNDIFIVMQNVVTITEDTVYPLSHSLPSLIPSETWRNRKFRGYIDNMSNTMRLLYLTHGHSKE